MSAGVPETTTREPKYQAVLTLAAPDHPPPPPSRPIPPPPPPKVKLPSVGDSVLGLRLFAVQVMSEESRWRGEEGHCTQ
jgi:hypothetical protein